VHVRRSVTLAGQPFISAVKPQMPIPLDIHFRQSDCSQLLAALQKCIDPQFNKSDWTTFAYSTGTDSFIVNHNRLLRSLDWGDDDYPSCVFEALRYFSKNNVDALEALIRHPKLVAALELEIPALLTSFGYQSNQVTPVVSLDLSAPEVVARAIRDSEALLKSGGAPSAVDRLHTALHGYFKHLCITGNLPLAENASITSAFKTLRSSHPVFLGLDSDVGKLLNGFGSIVDTLNTVRNNSSVAHPNALLLQEAEAQLMVNACKTLFHYVQAKVPAC
jgi:AbiJ N-terminal domain 5/Abortive infection C-terminus